eukprot:m.226694 g.226694  ORF g.226694 m.226694 type:complete len:172 (-) comp26403_c1_seq11:519-1034(-)
MHSPLAAILFTAVLSFTTITTAASPLPRQTTLNAPHLKFELWKRQHNKNYCASEASARRAIFLDNLEYINEHNARPGRTFDLELNELADLTHEEFKTRRLPLNITREKNVGMPHSRTSFAELTPPTNRDWREHGRNSCKGSRQLRKLLCVFSHWSFRRTSCPKNGQACFFQ